MTEHLLQYLWNYKLFKTFDFKDTEGNAVQIIDFGQWNQDAGVDFQLAKIKTNGLEFSGHIELHLRSSDWDFHRHSEDTAYHNVILHAVYEHDKDIDFLQKKNIPTIELKHYIEPQILKTYQELSKHNTFIPCEDLYLPDYEPLHFHERNVLNKLEEKCNRIKVQLADTKNDYEAVLFRNMAYGFGLKINAEIFQSIAESEAFSVVRKLSKNLTQMEAFLFGKAGFLEQTADTQTQLWKREFDFIQQKFGLKKVQFPPKFLRLRPPNFPTIRLSQLANLYHKHPNLFSEIIHTNSYQDLKKIFSNISTSEYWKNHYQFGKSTEKLSDKKLSSSFIDLLIINIILPLQYTYYKNTEGYTTDTILKIYQEIAPEKNTIIEHWETLGAKVKTALHSQSYLHQYKNFCIQKKCLSCTIGFRIIGNKTL